jgi:hypothetical protein
MPFTTTVGNSSLDGAGGFSIALRFWWHLRFPDEVIKCTHRLKRGNAEGTLILVNILEFVTMIINYCAGIHVIKTTPVTKDSSGPPQHHKQYVCLELDSPQVQAF